MKGWVFLIIFFIRLFVLLCYYYYLCKFWNFEIWIIEWKGFDGVGEGFKILYIL